MNKNKTSMTLYLKAYIVCTLSVWINDDLSLQKKQEEFVHAHYASFTYLNSCFQKHCTDDSRR